ncbi:unnamed protein product, partial [Mesorhabditis spiculigera]
MSGKHVMVEESQLSLKRSRAGAEDQVNDPPAVKKVVVGYSDSEGEDGEHPDEIMLDGYADPFPWVEPDRWNTKPNLALRLSRVYNERGMEYVMISMHAKADPGRRRRFLKRLCDFALEDDFNRISPSLGVDYLELDTHALETYKRLILRRLTSSSKKRNSGFIIGSPPRNVRTTTQTSSTCQQNRFRHPQQVYVKAETVGKTLNSLEVAEEALLLTKNRSWRIPLARGACCWDRCCWRKDLRVLDVKRQCVR